MKSPPTDPDPGPSELPPPHRMESVRVDDREVTITRHVHPPDQVLTPSPNDSMARQDALFELMQDGEL